MINLKYNKEQKKSSCRFVNLVSRSSDIELTWQNVKEIRSNYYKNNSVPTCIGFVIPEVIKIHYESLSMRLGFNNVTSKIENLSRKDISTAALMFVFLNSCPSYWVYFYHEIFKSTNSVSEIIQQTMNTFKKKTKRKGEYIASQLLSKLFSEFGFEYILPVQVEIEKKLPQTFSSNINNVKGDCILYMIVYVHV